MSGRWLLSQCSVPTWLPYGSYQMHFYALARHVALATGSITYFAITSTAISFLEEFFGTNWSIYPSDVNSRQMFDGFPV